jgi:hypothetical protein
MSSRHMRKLAITLIASVACKGSEHPQQGTDSTTSSPAAVSPAISAQPNSDACADRTIRGERVGRIAIGDPVDSLRKCSVVRDTVVSEDEGGKARKVSIALASDTIRAQILDGRVWRIEVSSPGPRTVDSLGVGTPLSRLLQMSNPRGASGEGQMFVRSPDHCGQSFEISYFGPMPSGGWTSTTMAKLPDTTHVIRVLVQRCHPALY